MKKILSVVLCVAMTLTCLPISTFGATRNAEQNEYFAKIEMAKDGADSIISMTYDDGIYDTAVFLNEQAKIYNLKASLMLIAQNHQSEKSQREWNEIFSSGYLEPQSHSMTHMVLPSNSWAEKNGLEYLDNNTQENYQNEIAMSKTALEEYFGKDVLTFAPSNNTLPADENAWAVIEDTYYAVRSGTHLVNLHGVQSLDPTVGHEAGGWHDLKMLSVYLSGSKNRAAELCGYLDKTIAEKGWLITFCHGIEDTEDSSLRANEAKQFFEYISQKQNEGKTWCAGFGEATKYIRERQASTVSEYETSDGLFVDLTMADKTSDGLSLSKEIFNYPLTVKAQVPSEWQGVYYKQADNGEFATVFAEDGKKYAYINIVPNGGTTRLFEAEVSSSVKNSLKSGYAESGNNADCVIDSENLYVSGKTVLTAKSGEKTYIKLSLKDFADERVYFGFKTQASDKGKLKIYGIADKSDAENWNSLTINSLNAPASNRITGGIDESKVYGNEPIKEIDVDGEKEYALDLTQYATHMKLLGAEYITIVFASDNSFADTQITIVPVENAKADKIVSSINFNDWSDITAAINEREVNSNVGLAASGFAFSSEYVSLASEDFSGDGKSVLFTPKEDYNRLKFYNIFDHNLTQADVGRKITVSFKVKADKAGSFVYGIFSAAPRVNGNYYTVADGETQDDKDYSQNAYPSESTGVISQTDIGKWKTFSFTFDVDETMLSKSIYFKRDEKYYDVAVALLGIVSKTMKDGSMYIDDIVVTEPNTDEAYSYFQEFESVSDVSEVAVANGCDMAYLTDDATKSSFVDTYKISSDENHSADGSKSLMLYSTANWNRFRLFNIFPEFTQKDIGKTYDVTFYMKANKTGTMKVGIIGDTSHSTYNVNAYGTVNKISVGETDVWKKYSYSLKVDAGMVENNLRCLLVQPDSFSQSKITEERNGKKYLVSTDPAIIYIDDVCVKKFVENAGTNLLICDKVSVNNNGKVSTQTLKVNGTDNTSVNFSKIKKAYMSFSGGYKNTQSAVLKINVIETSGKTIKVYGIESEKYPENLTYNTAPASNPDESMKSENVHKGTHIAEVEIKESGVYSVDVSDYVKNTESDEYIFAITSESSGGTEYVNFDFEKYSFSENVDYKTDDKVTVSNGKAEVSGNKIKILNVFGNGNQPITAGKKYIISADVISGQNCEFAIGLDSANSSEVAGEVKTVQVSADSETEIKFEYTATEKDETDGICAITIVKETSDSAGFALKNVNVISEDVIKISKAAELIVDTAKKIDVPTVEKVNIGISTNGINVKADGENLGNSSTKEYVRGSSVMLEAEGGTFMYWKDAGSGAIVSYEKQFKLNVGSERALVAVFVSDEDGIYVTFKNANDIIVAEGVKDNVTVPQNPYIYGYKFAGWYNKGEKVDIKAGDSVDVKENTVFNAGYTKDTAVYTVTVDGETKTYAYNDKVTVGAEATKDGKSFSYWKRDGKVASYSKDYSFYVAGNTTLEAVYGDSVSDKNVLIMAQPVMADENRIAFFAERNIDSENAVVEAGILLGTKAGLSLDASGVIKAVAKSTTNNGQYTVRKAKVSSGDTWYGRAYVIYSDKSGNIHTIYSNEVSKTVE